MKQARGVLYFAYGAAAFMVTGAQAQSDNATPAEKPAWAAEATMNPDYVGSGAPAAPATPSDDAAAPAVDDAASRAAEEEAATQAKRKADQEAEAAADKAAQEAEAQRKAEEEAATEAKRKADQEAEAAAEKAAQEAEAQRKAEEEAAAAKAKADAEAAEAKAAADAEAKRQADAEAAKAAAEAKLQQAIESCRDALNGELTASKFSFSNESWTVSRTGRAALDKIVDIIADCGDVTIEVGGHTDSVGSDVSNKRIAQLRADAVVATLKDKGVDGSKLSAVGYGKDKPIASNDTAEGRRQNRRIEFLVSAK